MPRERAAKRKVWQEKNLSLESFVDRQRCQQKKWSSERCLQKGCQEKGVWMHSRSCKHSRGMFSLPETSPAACQCTVCNDERDCILLLLPHPVWLGLRAFKKGSAGQPNAQPVVWSFCSSRFVVERLPGQTARTQTEPLEQTAYLFSTWCVCMWQFGLQGCETKQNMIPIGYIPDGLETGPWQQFHWVGCSTPGSKGAQFFAESDLRCIPGHS